VARFIFLSDYGPAGNGIGDDTTIIQNAIDDAILAESGLYIERPSVAYRITDTLHVAGVVALTIEGLGLPHIRYEGDPNKTVLRRES
jgi:hypothetical protein